MPNDEQKKTNISMSTLTQVQEQARRSQEVLEQATHAKAVGSQALQQAVTYWQQIEPIVKKMQTEQDHLNLQGLAYQRIMNDMLLGSVFTMEVTRPIWHADGYWTVETVKEIDWNRYALECGSSQNAITFLAYLDQYKIKEVKPDVEIVDKPDLKVVPKEEQAEN